MNRRPPLARFLPALALLCAALSAGGATQAERDFIWHEANARLAGAATRDDFMQAAAAYQRLVELGVRNAPLFYNQGTALIGAERYDEALAVLERAERYGGAQPDIGRNLQVARARRDKLKELSTPWNRVVIFWHYRLAGATRALILCGAFTVFWLGLTMRLVGRPRAARALIAVAIVALALFGSSMATSLHAEAAPPRLLFAWPAPR